MNFLCRKAAEYIAREKHLPSDYVETYKYGLTMMAETIFSTMITICIAAYLGIVFETLVFLICFAMFRSYAGGIHLKKFSYCCILSNAVIFWGIYLGQIINISLYVSLLILLLFVASIYYFMLKSKDCKEKEYFLVKTIRNTLALVLIVVTAIVLQLDIINIVLCAVGTVSLGCLLNSIIKGRAVYENIID